MWNDQVTLYGLEGASLKRVIWKYSKTRVLVNISVYLMSIIFGFIGPV
jgi:ATP-binding cassette subfamily C (CFTR/MRP) protein 5